MDFQITEEHRRLQQRCRQLAEDFATRAAQHDHEASDPLENYALLRQAGFYALNVPQELGGWGLGLLGYALAAEELAQGCPSTALAFNMHPCMVGPLLESPLVTTDVKQRIARLVVHDQQLLAGNVRSRPRQACWARPRRRHAPGGWTVGIASRAARPARR